MKIYDVSLKINLLKRNNLPKKEIFFFWIKTTVSFFCKQKKQISICIVDIQEMKRINSRYRFCNQPTNVLSFPFFNKRSSKFLGDMVFCKKVIELEAHKYKKDLHIYWAHIVIHGTLHLLGFSHKKKSQELKMQKIEAKIMCKLGYSNPYE